MRNRIEMSKMKMLEELQASLNELERAVILARQSLSEQKNLPKHILDRLEQYIKIIETQKQLAKKLTEAGNINEVFMLAEKINVLSKMIADDSSELVFSLMKSESQAVSLRKTYISC